jgi:multicomponent Na+:H+ antiporter subunit C
VTPFDLYAVAGVLVFLVGLVRLVTSSHLLRLILALHVMGSGAFLVLVATAYRFRAPEPDPVPHAMVLTGIVVTMGVTAFAVALVRRIHARHRPRVAARPPGGCTRSGAQALLMTAEGATGQDGWRPRRRSRCSCRWRRRCIAFVVGGRAHGRGTRSEAQPRRSRRRGAWQVIYERRPWRYEVGGWGAPAGIDLYVDGISAMLLLTTAGSACSWPPSPGGTSRRPITTSGRRLLAALALRRSPR